MKVLSLFNGMGCIWLALDELGIEVTARYSSEVDKYAIKANDTLYPDTVQLGDVRGVKGSDLGFIELLAGGSPCQSFSFAGKRNGMSTKCETEILTLDHYLQLKSEGYEFEGQSYLFWEYMRILNELRDINPNILFLLENVEMGERWEKVLSKAIGVNGIHINSALVSAQNRQRIYWTNIGLKPQGLFGDLLPTIQQPKDEGILLKEIIENSVSEKYYLSDKMQRWLTKHSQKRGSEFKQLDGLQKASCLTTTEAKQNLSNDYIKVGCVKFGRTDEAKEIRKESMKNGKDYAPFQAKEITDIDYEKMNTLTTVGNKDNLVIQLNPSTESGGKQPYQQNRVYDDKGKSPALDTRSDQKNVYLNHATRIRRLTPTECLRLQTVPEWAIEKLLNSGISDTQLYKMTGNGWTIKVISHILKSL